MKRLSGSEIRQMFLDFFESKDHDVFPPANLIPVDDDTLLWINSGVATLKPYFDGSVKPKNPRITNAQKSIRTNDIENVGITARHHTLFEMLGNFSIGEYFKEEAIVWAWEFLTSPDWIDMDPDDLYVTVYPEDKEARKIWEEVIGLSEDRVIDLEDNFWDIGPGPSGPNTEIFYDRGQEHNDLPEDHPESFPGGENARWLEIWNLVFSQFNHMPDDTYEPLPMKNIDTGLGLERMASVLQDTPTNFETDLFQPLMDHVGEISGRKYEDETLEVKSSYKIIADHVRAITMAIADGALPSNEGRGYILRRLLRRSVVHGHKLGIEEPFLYKLVSTVGEIMGDFYPETVERHDFVSDIIEKEEIRFHETLSEGMSLIENLISKLKDNGETEIAGEDAFKLYDTYGFPIELTHEFAEEADLTVDDEGFEEELEKQRQRARDRRKVSSSMEIQSDLFNNLKEESEFTGYTETEGKSSLVYMIVDGAVVPEVSEGTQAQVVFEETPFYAEKGGQVADTGVIRDEEGQIVAEVEDVQSAPGGQPLHFVDVKDKLELGKNYILEIDEKRRNLTRRNHTATHLLHQALRDELGEHVQQAGSLVAPDVLRFDFTHLSKVTDEELQNIEDAVNQKIWNNIPIETVETDLETAKDMGAIALFSEKYEDDVRVVQISDYSKELCGGTHVNETSDIGLFKIVSESGIGAGTRRITALTSQEAFNWMENRLDILDEVQGQVGAQTVEQIPERITNMQEEIKELEREHESFMHRLANAESSEIFDNIQKVNGYEVILETAEVESMDQLRQIADEWREEKVSDILVLGLAQEDKANLLVAISDELVSDGLKAGDLIKEIAPKIDGGGGGRESLAQAGGSKPEGLEEAYKAAIEWVENI